VTQKKSRRVLRLPAVKEMTGLGRDSIYRLGNDKDSGFPKPIKLSERASGWFEHELLEWLDARAKQRA
jgi:prophage regulatory protein